MHSPHCTYTPRRTWYKVFALMRANSSWPGRLNFVSSATVLHTLFSAPAEGPCVKLCMKTERKSEKSSDPGGPGCPMNPSSKSPKLELNRATQEQATRGQATSPAAGTAKRTLKRDYKYTMGPRRPNGKKPPLKNQSGPRWE